MLLHAGPLSRAGAWSLQALWLEATAGPSSYCAALTLVIVSTICIAHRH